MGIEAWLCYNFFITIIISPIVFAQLLRSIMLIACVGVCVCVCVCMCVTPVVLENYYLIDSKKLAHKTVYYLEDNRPKLYSLH